MGEFMHQIIALASDRMRRIKNDCECTIDLQSHCGPTVAVNDGKLGDGSRRKSKLAEIKNSDVQVGGVRPRVNRSIRSQTESNAGCGGGSFRLRLEPTSHVYRPTKSSAATIALWAARINSPSAFAVSTCTVFFFLK